MRTTATVFLASTLLLALGVFTARRAATQISGSLPAFVRIQTATPGQAQAGHSNITGTSIAGQFVGGGAGLQGVNADKLDGLDSTQFLKSVPVPLALTGNGTVLTVSGDGLMSDLVRINGQHSSPEATSLSVGASNGRAALEATMTGGNGFAVMGHRFGAGTAVAGFSETNVEDGIGVYAESNSPNGRALVASAFSSAGSTKAVDAFANSPFGTAVNGFVDSVAGTTVGVKGQVNSQVGTGVMGVTTSGIGPTAGVLGETQSGTGTGVSGVAKATSGTAFGVSGRSSASNGIGVFATNDHPTGPTRGLDAFVNSPFGVAVNAYANAASGGTTAVKGTVESPQGIGVIGINNAVFGSGSGVIGLSASPIGYGVFASGNLGASGLKTFKIDHPLDPAGKFLLHYSAEGPDPKNIYDGTVRTDAKGYADVRLPDYFESINRDPRIQLTVVDEEDSATFVQVKVVRKVVGNTFRIRTSAPGTEVFWRVEAVRNDRWVQRSGAPVEVQKSKAEQGKYLHPELYGRSPDESLHPWGRRAPVPGRGRP